MWTTSRLKEEAKLTFKKFGYWTPFFVTLLTGLICGGSRAGSVSSGYNAAAENYDQFSSGSAEIGEAFNEMGAALAEFFSNPFVAATTVSLVIFGLIAGLVFAFG